MFRRWLDAGLILLALTCWSGVVTAHAASDAAHALATAPQGILLSKPNAILTVATTSKSSATVVNTTNPAAPGTQAAVVTNNAGQFGSTWSTDDNSFDLTHNEQLSLWLYFGDQGNAATDGMAVVLQNDSRGVHAMPDWGNAPVSAETLGVWGVAAGTAVGSAKDIAATAIQNSWALEFDTNFNDKATRLTTGLDAGRTTAHIASGYPGLATSYLPLLPPATNAPTGYRLRHSGVISDATQPNFLANGAWHHLTLTWNATAQTMTYAFNDKNPVTETPEPGTRRTVAVDPKRIDPDHTGRVRWGFTGTTGTHAEDNLVVLENAPGLVTAQTSAQLTDLTQDKIVDHDDEVVSRDKVQLTYHLNYQGGRRVWSAIGGQLRLPAGIAYAKRATVTMANGQVTTVALSATRDGALTVAFKSALSRQNPSATVQVTGRILPVSTQQVVASVTSIFASSAFVGTATTPTFRVMPAVKLDLAVTSADPLVLPDLQKTTVTGKIGGFTRANVPPALCVTPKLNGATLARVTPQSDGTFTLSLAASQLQPGANVLKLTAVTASGDVSKTVTVPITVTGELKFDTVSSEEGFQASTLTGNSQLVGRTGDWRLVVQDTRGTGSRWTLNAQATALTTSDGQQLAGQPVYVTSHGSLPIGTTPTPVLTHVTDDSEDAGRFDVVGSWTPRTGMLLTVTDGSAIGHYSGTIVWTLSDAPS
ncbi:WxL domain-containing protein [Levilactobacillus enshiensis]|uniref:WxL domain-containing protein n=1 Tax=Levilactobacillus enshiensis TaxID=2590213 RepID=UPI00117ACC24|nr:WxL domain-containing protein [Levilactobacillus enshiensis]